MRKLSQCIVIRRNATRIFFAKHEFFDAIRKENLHIITRPKDDAGIWYFYHGLEKKTRGRPTTYLDKVSLKNIDSQYFIVIESTSSHVAYEAIIHDNFLKILLIYNLK